VLAGALFYLLSSTLATAALFLLIEPISREEGGIAAMLALTADAYGLDEREAQPEVGLAVPGTLALLGATFALCVIALAGLPPLSGFIGKVGMLRGMLAAELPVPALGWAFVALVILSGLATLIGLVRIGIQTFWATESEPPRLLALEIGPVLVLVAMLVLLTFKAEVTMRYMQQTARAVLEPAIYSQGVLGAPRTAETQEADQ
jgi:multicomponent K+:H+ antiporter subunit D